MKDINSLINKWMKEPTHYLFTQSYIWKVAKATFKRNFIIIMMMIIIDSNFYVWWGG